MRASRAAIPEDFGGSGLDRGSSVILEEINHSGANRGGHAQM
jgi:hypothetical protein